MIKWNASYKSEVNDKVIDFEGVDDRYQFVSCPPRQRQLFVQIIIFLSVCNKASKLNDFAQINPLF